MKVRILCPKCGQKDGVAILYGYPTETAFQQAERQEIALGGCMRERLMRLIVSA